MDKSTSFPFVWLSFQEEETSAAAARATNALRQYAQQLLNQAADKLARFVTHYCMTYQPVFIWWHDYV